MAQYADIIVDLSLDKLDKTFQYRIPDELCDDIACGVCVEVPFGNRSIRGYVVELSDEAKVSEERIRPITRACTDSIEIESQLIALAGWMRSNYGSTMNQALKTVLPVHRKTKPITRRRICLVLPMDEAKRQLALEEAKHHNARARLLRELIAQKEQSVCRGHDVLQIQHKQQQSQPKWHQQQEKQQSQLKWQQQEKQQEQSQQIQDNSCHQDEYMSGPTGLDYRLVTEKLGVSASVIRGMADKGILRIETDTTYRNPIGHLSVREYHLTLNTEQQAAVDHVILDMDAGLAKTYLIKGVTGSGKTEVYMELIAHTIEAGRQAIVLIPEISLTYQTVMRFYGRFGDRISILNSRMSQGERYDQYLRAKNGDIDIMIGPRSALFTPFARLGMIIMDEEHESSYKSETSPRYHARETAIERARLCGASVVLGSATPSVESYYRAQLGKYELLELTKRVEEKPLPECEVIDLRRELREGNRSILSTRLQELMEQGLAKGQQTMLFLNRRGVSGIMACRSCGEAIKCPHCDVTLSAHNNGYLICHYCGYRMPIPRTCPSCGSPYIAGYKAGTQKIEELVQQRFPQARILRMDYDTTRSKDSYEKILTAFSNQEADILIGTQMIVKGHDFPKVTLMGILAADMSLHASDYRAGERTFQLLTQAAGRAGRGTEPGRVIIQSYNPDHFAIQTACRQDYEAFYKQEIAYRRLLSYPPVSHMLVILASGKEQEELVNACTFIGRAIQASGEILENKAKLFGPTDASIAKLNDVFRMVLYIKSADYAVLVRLREQTDRFIQENEASFRRVTVQFDFDPMSSF